MNGLDQTRCSSLLRSLVAPCNPEERAVTAREFVSVSLRPPSATVTGRSTGAVLERPGPTPASYAGRGDRWDMGPAFGDTVAEWRERQIGSSGAHGWPVKRSSQGS